MSYYKLVQDPIHCCLIWVLDIWNVLECVCFLKIGITFEPFLCDNKNLKLCKDQLYNSVCVCIICLSRSTPGPCSRGCWNSSDHLRSVLPHSYVSGSLTNRLILSLKQTEVDHGCRNLNSDLSVIFVPYDWIAFQHIIHTTQQGHFLFHTALRKILFSIQQSVDLYKTSAWHKEDKNDQFWIFFFFFK